MGIDQGRGRTGCRMVALAAKLVRSARARVVTIEAKTFAKVTGTRAELNLARRCPRSCDRTRALRRKVGGCSGLRGGLIMLVPIKARPLKSLRLALNS